MPRNELLSRLGVALRLAAAGVWLVAGASKLAGLEEFRQQVAAYDLLPDALVAPFAYALPFVEVVVGLYLAAGLFVRGAALLGTALMAAFLAAQGLPWARGLVLDCGCFGALAREHVGAASLLRDIHSACPRS